jgi:hypothetical protein
MRFCLKAASLVIYAIDLRHLCGRELLDPDEILSERKISQPDPKYLELR